MIKSLNIQNYKLFNNISIENIPQILLIGGKNNAGKTSILEALFFPLDCTNPAMFIRSLGWRGLNTISNNADSLFAPAFHNLNLDKPITLEYLLNSSKKRFVYQFLPSIQQPIPVQSGNVIDIQKTRIDDTGGVEFSYGTGKNVQKALLRQEQEGLQLKAERQLRKYNEGILTVFLSSTNNTSPQEDAERFGELDKSNKIEDILKALQILEPRLQSLSINPIAGNQQVLHGDTGIGKKVPLSLMGQGINRLTSILLAISYAKNGIVLVDELENGFHHSALASVWEVIASYAKSKKTQIMATTHSMELISGAIEGIPKDLRNDFKYIRIERREDEFMVKNYNFESLSIALENEIEIR